MKKQIKIESSTKGISLSGELNFVSANDLVVLFSGSGAQDLDETIGGKKPFLSLSRELNQAGYDVFRWNDRGVNGSQGDYYSSTPVDIIDDGINVISHFRDNANYNRIIVLGHSQGALIATEVATIIKVDALILCAGIFRDGKVALLDQHTSICKGLGYTSLEIEDSVRQKEEVFNILIDFENQNKDNNLAINYLKKILWDYYLGRYEKKQLSKQEIKDFEFIIDDLSEWEWRYILTQNNAVNLMKLNIPILVISGDKDSQVNTAEEIGYLKSLKLGNVKSCILKDHNHLFQLCMDGNIGNYNNLGEPFTKKSATIIIEWLRNEI